MSEEVKETSATASQETETQETQETQEAQETKQESILGGEQDPAKDPAASGDAGGELDITLPEGFEPDEKMIAGFTEFAKENSLNSETATAMVAWYAEQQKATIEETSNSWEAQGAKNIDVLKSDPEFGGTNFKGNVVNAQRGVMALGGKELAKDLMVHGVDNLPSLVKAFARHGALVSEDNSGVPGAKAGQGGQVSQEDRLKTRYPNSQKE